MVKIQKCKSVISYNNYMKFISEISGYAIGIAVLTLVIVIIITLFSGFKDAGLVDNTITDSYICPLVIFGTLIGVIVLSFVCKIIKTVIMFKD